LAAVIRRNGPQNAAQATFILEWTPLSSLEPAQLQAEVRKCGVLCEICVAELIEPVTHIGLALF